jgi:hypothetical protein
LEGSHRPVPKAFGGCEHLELLGYQAVPLPTPGIFTFCF